MQQTEIKDPCRYCADWKWHCRGMCLKKMQYIAVNRELEKDKNKQEGINDSEEINKYKGHGTT